MAEPQIQIELRNFEDKISGRYSRFSKLFLVLAILFIILTAIVFAGVIIFGQGHDWALLSLDGWMVTFSALIGFFIILEIIFYFHFSSVRDKRIELEKPKPEYIDSKKIHVYTFPKDAEGGIFSKTYIELDDHSILRLRTLMIPPEDLW